MRSTPRSAQAPPSARESSSGLDALIADIRSCRLCRDNAGERPLPHEPRPVFRVSATARIGVFSQAPGTRANASGMPFTDPSGVRLRQWMGLTADQFYDASRVAVVPMGFCFPGLDRHGGDLPPRRECAPRWRSALLSELGNLELILLIGGYAQAWHLGSGNGGVTETVSDWRRIRELSGKSGPVFWPLPHPSWRNNAWLKKNPWFADELVPSLQDAVARAFSKPVADQS